MMLTSEVFYLLLQT